MSDTQKDVEHIINFLIDNEIETGHKRGVEPLKEILKENIELKTIIRDKLNNIGIEVETGWRRFEKIGGKRILK